MAPAAGYPAALLAGYGLGSLPTAIWVCRIFFRVDITCIGSGNPGMTNVWRAFGWRPALPVALLDAGKGAAAAAVGLAWTHSAVGALAAGAAAVLGHAYSFLSGFKGGKGVLTAFGVFVFLSPIASLLALGLWGAVMGLSRIVSLASLASALVLPPLVFWEARWHSAGGFVPVFWVALLVAVFVIVRHRANIVRLLQGAEPRFRGKAT